MWPAGLPIETQHMPQRAPDRASSPLPPVAEATRAATIGLAGAALGLVAAYAALPGQRAWLAAGNGLTDSATAVLLLLTAAVGWWVIRRTPGVARWCHLLPVAALLGFLDEVHYGVGLLGFELPRVGRVTVDGVSSILAVTQDVAERQLGLSPLDMAAGAALAAAVLAFVLARHHRAARAAAWLADRPPAVHLLGAAILIMPAVALDLVGGTGVVRFAEEWAEFTAAAILFRGTLLIPRHDPEAVGWRQRLRPWLDGDAPQRAMPSGASWKAGP
jgi:hypothetical protein